MKQEKQVSWWYKVPWQLYAGLVFCCLGIFAYCLYVHWIPFGQDFMLTDGVLTVRRAYFSGFFFSLIWVLWVVVLIQAIAAIFSKKAVRLRVFAFAGVALLIIGCTVLDVVTARGFPFLIRDERTIKICEYLDEFADVTKFDRRCLAFVATYDFEHPSLPQDLSNEKNGVYVSLDHVHGCCCSLKEKKQFISADGFPFDSSVLLYAVAQGRIDPSLAGSAVRQQVSIS